MIQWLHLGGDRPRDGHTSGLPHLTSSIHHLCIPSTPPSKNWTNASYMMYVDDGNISVRGPTYTSLEQKLRECYAECHRWCLRAGLIIKPEKTKIIFFSHTQPNPVLHSLCPSTVYLPDWEFSMYYTIAASDNICYLGLHFDHKLTWDKHRYPQSYAAPQKLSVGPQSW
jgi:hypothetical protein